MAMWRERHAIYILCFCGLLMAGVAYIVGFSCPYWSHLQLEDYGYYDQTIGLWQVCTVDLGTCVSGVSRNNPTHVPYVLLLSVRCLIIPVLVMLGQFNATMSSSKNFSWLNAARGLCSISLVFFIFSIITGFASFCSVVTVSSRYSECLALLAVVAGFVGSIIFAAEFHQIYVNKVNIGTLDWGFGLVIASLSLATLCACVMLVFSNRLVRRRPRTGFLSRGANGCHVTIVLQDAEGDVVRLPYFGDVRRDQLVYGAAPILPPSYDMVTGDITNSGGLPSEAPPPYCPDMTKHATVLPPPHPPPPHPPPPAYNMQADWDSQKASTSLEHH